MELARDLASADLWAESLERSLARRGRPRRASLALGRLTAERDLTDPMTLGESVAYARARRAASSSFTVPAAGGASVLALLAATTLPSLTGGGTQPLRRGALHRSGARTGPADAPPLIVPHERVSRVLDPLLSARVFAPFAKPVSAAAKKAPATASPKRTAVTKTATAATHHAVRLDASVTPATRAHVLLLAAHVSSARTVSRAAVLRAHVLADVAPDTHVLDVGAARAPAPAASTTVEQPSAPAAVTTAAVTASTSAPAATTSAPARSAATTGTSAPATAPAAQPVYGQVIFGDIRDAQRMLGVPVDGILGPVTGAAIRAFQASHSLTVDGIVGRETWDALAAAEHARWAAEHRAAAAAQAVRSTPVVEASTLQTPSATGSTADVIALQEKLGITADGDFGPETLAAVQAFQSAHGLTPDGIVGPDTRAALGLGAGPTLQELGPTGAAVDAPAPTTTTDTTTSTTTTTPTATTDPTTTDATTPSTDTTDGAADATAPSAATTTTGGPSSSVQTGLSEMIAAANQIATLPYIYGGGHGSWISPGYDCSGSVSYVLHAAGLLSAPEDSSELMSYGAPGPGQYITIYSTPGHAWMTIEGRRFDTVALAETGTRWADGGGEFAGFVERHPIGY